MDHPCFLDRVIAQVGETVNSLLFSCNEPDEIRPLRAVGPYGFSCTCKIPSNPGPLTTSFTRTIGIHVDSFRYCSHEKRLYGSGYIIGKMSEVLIGSPSIRCGMWIDLAYSKIRSSCIPSDSMLAIVTVGYPLHLVITLPRTIRAYVGRLVGPPNSRGADRFRAPFILSRQG